jgi:hypothetical protein
VIFSVVIYCTPQLLDLRIDPLDETSAEQSVVARKQLPVTPTEPARLDYLKM